MVVHPMILQNKGRGPVAQIDHVRIGVLLGQKIGRIEEVIRTSHAAAQEVKDRVPGAVQGDPAPPGQGLVASLKQEVGVGDGSGGRVGIPEEETYVVLGQGHIIVVAQDQE